MPPLFHLSVMVDLFKNLSETLYHIMWNIFDKAHFAGAAHCVYI